MTTRPPRLADYTRDIAQYQRSLDFVRYVLCLHSADGIVHKALQIYQDRFPHTVSTAEIVTKAAVAAGTTTDSVWAHPLVPVQQQATAFVGLARAASLVGQIPNLYRVPFNTAVPVQTAGGSYTWIGEAKPKPLSALAFATASVGFAKITGLVVITSELAKLSTPSAVEVVHNDMIAGVAAFMDQQFVDPAIAAIAGVRPASITNGVTPTAPSGATAAALLTDIKGLLKAFRTAHGSLANVVLLMNAEDAFTLNVALGKTDASVTTTGLWGIPVVVSSSVGAQIVALDPTAVLYADEGEIRFDVSRSASVQMDSAPTSPVDATTVLVSLWQHNMIGLRCERFTTWAKARSTAVATVGPTAYV